MLVAVPPTRRVFLERGRPQGLAELEFEAANVNRLSGLPPSGRVVHDTALWQPDMPPVSGIVSCLALTGSFPARFFPLIRASPHSSTMAFTGAADVTVSLRLTHECDARRSALQVLTCAPLSRAMVRAARNAGNPARADAWALPVRLLAAGFFRAQIPPAPGRRFSCRESSGWRRPATRRSARLAR